MEQIISIATIYFYIAILYNVLSQISLDLLKRKFAPTEPMNGLLTVSVVFIIFLLKDTLPLSAHLILLSVFTLFIARFGVVHHIFNFDSQAYLSRFTWASAFLINIFGVGILLTYVVMNIIALVTI